MKEAGVGDWVTKRHRLTPDKVAVIFEEREWTYRELNERVNQAARMLLELGLVKGDRIAILANNCNAFLELFWACAKTGVVFVPLNTRLVSRELEYFLIQAAPEALFYGGGILGHGQGTEVLAGCGKRPELYLHRPAAGHDRWRLRGLDRAMPRRGAAGCGSSDDGGSAGHPVYLGNDGPGQGGHSAAPENPLEHAQQRKRLRLYHLQRHLYSQPAHVPFRGAVYRDDAGHP